MPPRTKAAASSTGQSPKRPVGKRPKKGASPSTSPASETSSSSSDVNSSDLDEDDGKAKGKKRSRASYGKGKKATDDDYGGTEDEDEAGEEDDESEDENGRKVIGVAPRAPTTGLVGPGRISQNTLDFLKLLAVPANNDRDWFWRHEAVYRVAQKEWYAFIDTLIPKLIDVDDEIPFVKANDVAHRINRDVRFSKDKTPYKRNLSMSISRSGRKGIFAYYHLSIMPGRSMIAFGIWGPQKDELANIRSSFNRHPKRFRRIINHPAFVKEFGSGEPPAAAPKKKPVKRRKRGESVSESEEERPEKQVEASRRRNVYGAEDALKTAPKGVSKDDPNIDLLKLRSIAVSKSLSDAQVVDPNFMDEVLRLATVARPFIRYLNEIVTVPDEDQDQDEEAQENS